MKNIFQNKDVEHSFYCHSVSCLLNEDGKKHRHVSVWYFDTKTESYNAETLHQAAIMWVAGGQKELLEVGKIG